MAKTAVQTFIEKSPSIMKLLMADFGLSEEQAAGIVGSLGHESAGFTAFQEVNPRGGRGGWGWAQWTGPRRVQFEAYCARNHLDPKSDKANYGWLFFELKGSEKGAIDALKKTTTLKTAVRAFERSFERAGVPAYASRERWAQRALDAFHAASGSDEVKRIQQKLHDLGHGEVVGPIDGIIGPRTTKGIMTALGV
jgi:hypothetical protein